MKLFASGCSFTWGGELIKVLHDEDGNILDENNTCELNQYRLSITWPKHLSDKLGCSEFHNHSMGCGSNARIVRKTLDFFLPKILNNEDLSDWVVAIQWTEPSRFEFYDEISKSWAIAKYDVALFEKHRNTDVDDKQNILHYYSYNNDIVWGQQFFTQINALGNFFKAHGIRYVFTMIHESFAHTLTEQQKRYCNENFVWYANDMIVGTIDRMKVEPCINDPHPSIVGHQQIAEKLFSFLSNQNY